MANSLNYESGRSGGAGYTDPNNNDLNETEYECGREDDAAPASLVGFRGGHRLSLVRIQEKFDKCKRVFR